MDEIDTQKKIFIPKNICDNEKYVPATKYATITPLQKVQEKQFWALIFQSPYSLTTVAKLSALDAFGTRGLWTYLIIPSLNQINKRGITIKVLLKQFQIIVWS